MVCRPRCANDNIVRDPVRATSVCKRCGLVQGDSCNIDDSETGTARCSTDKSASSGTSKKDQRYSVCRTNTAHQLARSRVQKAVDQLLHGAPRSNTLMNLYVRLIVEHREPDARDAMIDWAVAAIWFVVVLKQQRWTSLEFESRLCDDELLSRAKKIARLFLRKDPMTEQDYQRVVCRWVAEHEALQALVSVRDAFSAGSLLWRYMQSNPDNKHMMRTLVAAALYRAANGPLRERKLELHTLSKVFRVVNGTINLVHKKLVAFVDEQGAPERRPPAKRRRAAGAQGAAGPSPAKRRRARQSF